MVKGSGRAAVFLLACFMAACVPGHQVEMRTAGRHREGLRALAVRADLPAGKMRVSLGAPADLYRLRFSYCRNHFRVLNRFQPEGAEAGFPGKSLLEIAALPLNGDAAKAAAVEPNLMELLLCPGVPLDLRLSVGEGEMDLDLTALGVQSLLLHGGSGRTTVRFSAANSREMELMRFVAGPGPVRLEGLGWGEVRSLEFHGGAGEANLDWSGPGPQEAAAFLDPGTGGLRLSFPYDLGVRVSAVGEPPGIRSQGFRRQGAAWVSSNWLESGRHLSLVLDAGEGEVAYSWKPR
jgi:hypothetical protein